jgi:hypothetical protein
LSAEELEEFMSDPNNMNIDFNEKVESPSVSPERKEMEEAEKRYAEYVKKGGDEDRNIFLSLSKDEQQKLIDCL